MLLDRIDIVGVVQLSEKLAMLIPPAVLKAISKIRSGPFSQTGMSREVKVVFDIGANIGDVTLAACRSFPQARIYAFEPVQKTYAELLKNTSAYSDRVNAYPFGLFNENRKSVINISSFHGASSIIPQSDDHKRVHQDLNIKEVGKEEIELRTMDSFVEEAGIEKIDIIKIDVEGVEREVIQGGRNCLRNRVDNVLVELSLLRRNRESDYWIKICADLYDFGFMLINLYDVARYKENDRTYLAQMDEFFSKTR